MMMPRSNRAPLGREKSVTRSFAPRGPAARRGSRRATPFTLLADALLHPLVLAAIALLVANDHLLKQRYPGWWTGKLSDFAGLLFFPLLLAGAIEWLAGSRPTAAPDPRADDSGSRRLLLGCAVATAIVFAAIKLWDPAGELYRAGLAILRWPVRAAIALATGADLPALGRAALVRDPTDLIALPALLVPLWLVRPRAPDRSRPPALAGHGTVELA
jgi:hypothetical protein